MNTKTAKTIADAVEAKRLAEAEAAEEAKRKAEEAAEAEAKRQAEEKAKKEAEEKKHNEAVDGEESKSELEEMKKEVLEKCSPGDAYNPTECDAACKPVRTAGFCTHASFYLTPDDGGESTPLCWHVCGDDILAPRPPGHRRGVAGGERGGADAVAPRVRRGAQGRGAVARVGAPQVQGRVLRACLRMGGRAARRRDQGAEPPPRRQRRRQQGGREVAAWARPAARVP